jgi:ATP-dependent helicase YprA (DUF1998 family)
MNHVYLDPIAAISQPRADFIRYLLTAYPLKDQTLRQKLEDKLNQPGIIWQHPYVEGSQPYLAGKSLSELVDQGMLQMGIMTLFPSDRRLYDHQQAAITAVVQDQQNIVVATGTGSGKTECFLIPMLDRLLQENDGLATAGVRALILYPMNALVNDQVKRLRQILCQQDPHLPLIRFGFYTSRTETDPKDALESLRAELTSYDPSELRSLFTVAEQTQLNLSTRDRLINEAIKKIQSIQALSRQEIWKKPPHILVTNYSMLEHMLIRPTERQEIFVASSNTFNTLIVDEAHTYDGATGTEVSMLLKRFKVALNQEQAHIRCIATSASLGDRTKDKTVLEFVRDLFDEPFTQVIRGTRQPAISRLGKPYTVPNDWENQNLLEILSILQIPEPTAPLADWQRELSYWVPSEQLAIAEQSAAGDFHRLLWFALKQHPLIHRLINLLSQAPQRWPDIVQSTDLWQVELSRCLDDTVDPDAFQMAEAALSRLLQLGTLARERSEDLPLLPVRLHLLFRGMEGVYSCVNPACREIYLNEKHTCDRCSSPVLELGSCAQCGEDYALTHRDSKGRLLPLPRTNQAVKDKNADIYTLKLQPPLSRVEEEENELLDEIVGAAEDPLTRTFSILRAGDGWVGHPQLQPFNEQINSKDQEFHLTWHRHKDDEGTNGCYLPKCAACGSRPNRSQAINRFIAYTDAPLEAMIDTLFELLPESKQRAAEASKRKLLTFSDGRQDAAFFASDFQRNHTEMLYRQMVWQAFGQAENSNKIASVKQLISALSELFLKVPIPHPDRNSSDHHRSYCSTDPMNRLDNELDCREYAEKRAKELVLREFAIPYARRSSLEAYALLACHIQLRSDADIVQWTAQEFELPLAEAHLLLLGLTDIIRRSGIVSIQGASAYFPETGGVEGSRFRPPVLDDKGRSKQVVFLEKTEEDKKNKSYEASPAFLRGADAGSMNRLNRLGWYFRQMLPSQTPSREVLVGLFQQLQNSKLLVNHTTKKGYHLNWDLLNITRTEADWYQCDRCQQVVHIPGLSQLDNPKLNLNGCRAYRCTGKLHPYTAEKIQTQAQTHYQQYLIKERQPLPLRSEEHTAQLGTEELAQRENNFRQGNINLLSCSTTLEMGVDIGELQAVVLRNFPPHVSNYQQRAGRAGRRTDGVALTLMYGQRRPHDRFYFKEPERLIAGTNQIPRLDPSNEQIQQRHIRAELLSAFLATQNLGAEKVRVADFFGLDHDHPVHIDAPEPSSMMARFENWLHSNHARELAKEWLGRLVNDTSPKSLLTNFLEDLQHFKNEQLSDWNELVDLLTPLLQEIIALGSNRKERRPLEGRRDNFEAELRKVASRQLHDQLVQASILPIYGFPIDVVRLLTGKSNEFRASKGKHRLERDRRLALSEYAPGQDIVVDDRVYHSVGVMRPEDLEQKYYWVCKFCNHFESYVDGSQTIEECPTCRRRPEPNHQKVYAYRVPKAFATDWTKEPEVTPYLKPSRQPTSQVFLASLGNPSESWTDPNQIYSLTSSRSGQFFLANRGGFVKGYHAFHICQRCGRDLTEQVQQQESTKKGKRSGTQQKSARSQLEHKHPLRGTDCQGGYDCLHLGHEFKSDLLKIEFCNSPHRPPALFGGEVAHYQGDRTVESVASDPTTDANSGRSFWHSLTYALLAAAAEVLDIRREELDGLFRPLSNGQAEVIIYDNVPGGAGYSRRIAEGFAEVLQKAYELTSTCSCPNSCYDCLCTYSNQIFHAGLDRHLVAEFLQPIVETIRPDEILQAFGRGSHRASLGAIADELTVLFRTAQTALLYLPQLQDDFKLNHNAPIPWISLLTEAVNSTRNSGTPLQLIVQQLPAPDSDNHRFLRKRLVQWIDEGVLVLYKSEIDQLPLLTVSTDQSAQTALGLHRPTDSSYEWLQTRQSGGVKEVQQRLHQMKEYLIPVSDLEDADTTLITPKPGSEWDHLTLEELQQKLGLTICLSGSQITKLTYRDRYFYESGAKLFAALLQSENIMSDCQILIETQENSRDKYPLPAPERQRQLEAALAPLCSSGANLTVTVHLDRSLRIEHKRILEIWRADGDCYRVIFDKGIDFLKKGIDQSYHVKEPTYVVINRTSGSHLG